MPRTPRPDPGSVTPATPAPGPAGAVEALLRQRQTVQGWLDRLAEHGGEISPRVVERVRADYQERLDSVLEALSTHQGSLRSELDRQRTGLRAATERLQSAADEVEEARLRQLIGELSGEDWEARRPALEEEVEAARAEKEGIEREVARLEEILDQFEARPDAERESMAPVEVSELMPEESATLEEAPTVERATPDEATLEEHPAEDEEPRSVDDLSFLEGLDRVIGLSDDEEASTPPAPGIKCAECGYTNDATAWYCGVCGADLT